MRAFSNDSVHASELELRLAEDPAWESSVQYDFFALNPRNVFAGVFTVEGLPPLQAVPQKVLREVYSFVEWKTGNWDVMVMLREELGEVISSMPFSERLKKLETDDIADLVRAAPQPFREVCISRSAAPPKPAKSSKMEAAQASGRSASLQPSALQTGGGAGADVPARTPETPVRCP